MSTSRHSPSGRLYTVEDPHKRVIDSTPTGDPKMMVTVGKDNVREVLRVGIGHESLVFSWLTKEMGVFLSTGSTYPPAREWITNEVHSPHIDEYRVELDRGSPNCALKIPVECSSISVSGMISGDSVQLVISMMLDPPPRDPSPVPAPPPVPVLQPLRLRTVDDETRRRRERSRSRERDLIVVNDAPPPSDYMTRTEMEEHVLKSLKPTMGYLHLTMGCQTIISYEKPTFQPQPFYRREDVERTIRLRESEILRRIEAARSGRHHF